MPDVEAYEALLLTARRVEVDRDVFALGKAVEHPLERELPPDAALLVATIGVSGRLAKSLVYLDPARFDHAPPAARCRCRGSRYRRRDHNGCRWPCGSRRPRRARGSRLAPGRKFPRAPAASRSRRRRTRLEWRNTLR